MNKEKRFEKVVEWEKDELGFFSSWIMIIFIALFYPIFYISECRKVYYREIKE
jgi:hypothetical protein